MSIDFSIFQKNENLLFFLIYLLVVIIAVAVLGFVIFSIFRLLKSVFKKIFPKNENDYEYGENFEVVVPEVEKSRQERQKIAERQQEFGKGSTHGPRMEYISAKSEKKEELKKDQKLSFDEKEKKDIEEGLSALKKSAKKGGQEEEQSVFSKIKIPRAKRFTHDDSAGGEKSDTKERIGSEKDLSAESQEENFDEKEKKDMEEGLSALKKSGIKGYQKKGDAEKKLADYRFDAIKEDSAIKNDRSGMLRGAEIKIPKNNESVPESEGVHISSKLHDEIGRPKADTSKIPGDNSIFGGKSEVSRIALRQKLRNDPKIYKAQREAGLFNLDRITRAKLEKDIFPTAYGRNISRTDLKWNIKRLGREWSSAKDMKTKETLRKEIKFFKKIGGIK